MKFNISLLLVCFSFPSMVCAMNMDPAAPALQIGEKTHLSAKMENCFDKRLMCLCGPCFRGSERAIKEISSHCTGQELSSSVLCMGYACCSMQALFWDLLYREGLRPEERRPAALDGFYALSSCGGVCLAYIVHRLEQFQKQQQMAPAEHTKVE